MAIYTLGNPKLGEYIENPIVVTDENLNTAHSWEGHTHKEVESYLCTVINKLSDTSSDKIIITLEGSDNKVFQTEDESATIGFYVDYEYDGSPSTSYTVDLYIVEANTNTPTYIWQGYRPGASSSTLITTNNLIDYLKARGSLVNFVLRVYSEESNISRSRPITFNRRQAKITSNNEFGLIWKTTNHITLRYERLLDYGNLSTGNIGTTTIVSRFTDEAGNQRIVETPTGSATQGTTLVSIPVDLANGVWTIDSYIILGDPLATEGNHVTDCIIVEHNGTDSPAPPANTIYIAAVVDGNPKINNYVDINYLVYFTGQESITRPVVLLKSVNGIYITLAIKTIQNGQSYSWRYFVSEPSTTLLFIVPYVDGNGDIIYLQNGSLSRESSYILTFTSTLSDIEWEQATQGLLFSLSALNKSNEDLNKDEWLDRGYHMSFTDMLWDSSGSGWTTLNYQNDQGENLRSTALMFIGKSRGTIADFYPFYGSSLSTGCTLKMTFYVDNVSDPNGNIIECYDGNMGFYVTGNGIYLKVGTELIHSPLRNPAVARTNTRRFQDKNKIDLTIVIPAESAARKDVYYYINGEVAGYTLLSNYYTLVNYTQSVATPLSFGGDNAVLYLFDVKYYNRPLTLVEVYHTYVMSLDDSTTIKNLFNKNLFYTSLNQKMYVTLTDAINYGKWLATKGVTNFAVWISTNLANAEDGVAVGDRDKGTSDVTTRGELFYWIRFKLDASGNGIIDPDTTFYLSGVISSTGHSSLRIRRQGTSTVSATKGNLRIDIRGKEGPVYLYRFISEAAGFNTEPDLTFTKNKAKVWQVPDVNSIECYLLTLKKNPNDSTQARNLPTARWYEDAARYLATYQLNREYVYEDCLTLPLRVELLSIENNRPSVGSRALQVAEIKTRQCVDGIPSVGFRLNYSYVSSDGKNADLLSRFNPFNNSLTSFAGLFDAITDKTNMDVFGFGIRNTQDSSGNIVQTALDQNDEDFSVEWRNNGSDVCCFQTGDLSGKNSEDDGNATLEYRYPDTEVLIPWLDSLQYGGNYTGPTIGLEKDGPILRLFDLVNTCTPLKSDPNYASLLLGTFYYNGTFYDPNYSGTDTHKKKGLSAIQALGGTSGQIPYRNGDGTIHHWVTDNKANRTAIFRNELKYCVVVNLFLLNGLLIDVGLMVDLDVKNQFFTHFTGENDAYNNKLLRLLGYDFDSSWGVDNDNFFRFNYTVKYEDGLYDGMGSKSPYSMLWKLIYECFLTELAKIAELLYQGGFLKEAGMNKYMFTEEVDVYNSAIYNANSEYSYIGDNSADWPKVHGSAREHNKWFLEGRMYYIGSRYPASGCDLYLDICEFIPGYSSPSESFSTNPFYIKRELTGTHGYIFEMAATAYERTGVGFRVNGQSGQVKPIDVDIQYDGVTYLPIGEPTSEKVYFGMPVGVATIGASDYHMSIVGCKNLKSLEGLPYLFIETIPNWGNLINIESLLIGSTEVITLNGVDYKYENPFLLDLNFTGKLFGSCKELNIAGLTGLILPILALSQFPVLETLEARNMPGIREIILPSGSSVQSVYYPSNMVAWRVDNKPHLTTINFEGYSSITTISVTNSSLTAAKKAIELLNNLMNI